MQNELTKIASEQGMIETEVISKQELNERKEEEAVKTARSEFMVANDNEELLDELYDGRNFYRAEARKKKKEKGTKVNMKASMHTIPQFNRSESVAPKVTLTICEKCSKYHNNNYFILEFLKLKYVSLHFWQNFRFKDSTRSY